MSYFVHRHGCRGSQNMFVLKAAYDLSPQSVQPALNEPPEILGDPVIDGDIMSAEADLLPKINFTDLVVLGDACAPNGSPRKTLSVGIRLNGQQREISVTGQRYAQMHNGRISFSEPEPFDRVPLTYTEAYGGVDEPNQASGDIWDLKNLSEAMGRDMSWMNLNRYRRNPVGKGYVLQWTANHDRVLLPRLEWPGQQLRPETLALGNPLEWYRLPSPAGFGWIHPNWFPRSAFLGGKLLKDPRLEIPPGQRLPEYSFGYSEDELFKVLPAHELVSAPRVFNAAHPAMQWPSMKGKQTLTLVHLDPAVHEWRIPLPMKRPRFHLEAPGHAKTFKGDGNLSSVCVDLNRRRLEMVWHAQIRTTYPVLPDKVEKMNYKVSF